MQHVSDFLHKSLWVHCRPFRNLIIVCIYQVHICRCISIPLDIRGAPLCLFCDRLNSLSIGFSSTSTATAQFVFLSSKNRCGSPWQLNPSWPLLSNLSAALYYWFAFVVQTSSTVSLELLGLWSSLRRSFQNTIHCYIIILKTLTDSTVRRKLDEKECRHCQRE